jgi:aryl carrier-like protein
VNLSERYQHIADHADLLDLVRAAAPRRARRDLDLRTSYEPPSSHEESQLVEIWQEVLGVDEIGVCDSLFELGGDSLRMTQILARVRQHFGCDVPIEILFDTPTIRHLATAMATASTPSAADAGQDLARMLDLVERLSDAGSH